jgi:hypothetical protein
MPYLLSLCAIEGLAKVAGMLVRHRVTLTVNKFDCAGENVSGERRVLQRKAGLTG